MASRKWRQHVLDYAAFGTMQLRFTIFTKLFHSVQFLTIRQSQLRIRCLRRKKQKMFSKKHCLNFNAIIKQKSIHVGEWSQKSNVRSPSYKNTLVGAKLGVFFVFCHNNLFRQNELVQGGFSPLATLWNCTIVYLIIATNATHMQARTIITVLDFLLAQNTPPVALWACWRRFFAPRDSARPEIR